MNKKIITVKKLLSEKTINELDNALCKGNISSLKKQMEKLFTFKNIFNMHDDHLIELAECIVDIARAENKAEYAYAIEQYAQRRIACYQERKKKLITKNQWANASKSVNEITLMDLKYRLWVYESGFEYSRFHMYSMLYNITQDVQKYEKEGTK